MQLIGFFRSPHWFDVIEHLAQMLPEVVNPWNYEVSVRHTMAHMPYDPAQTTGGICAVFMAEMLYEVARMALEEKD